jgi:hypothetical protein
MKVLNEYGQTQLREAKTASARLLKRWFRADPNGDVELRKKLKAILTITNMNELPIGGMTKSLLESNNAKPFMTGPNCHTFFRRDKYLEVDCDWHKFQYLALKSIPSVYEFGSHAIFNLGLVVQGTSTLFLCTYLFIGSVCLFARGPGK